MFVEQELIELCKATDGIEQDHLQQTREDVTALLGEDQNIGIVLVYSKDILENEENLFKAKKQILIRKPQKGIFLAGRIIEDLFDMLPTLMSVQHAHCLYLESASPRQIGNREGSMAISSGSRRSVNQDLIETSPRNSNVSLRESSRPTKQATDMQRPIKSGQHDENIPLDEKTDLNIAHALENLGQIGDS